MGGSGLSDICDPIFVYLCFLRLTNSWIYRYLRSRVPHKLNIVIHKFHDSRSRARFETPYVNIYSELHVILRKVDVVKTLQFLKAFLFTNFETPVVDGGEKYRFVGSF